ncbi:hypothetical protein BDV40DRAFT_273462 [Aspergillus tamarii]|uniref:Uncharacterized protein n=1 Tax=Aspergillus tamarii TaxID=41984 RepID=A0A5N6ULF3_ASPTM|nr:hypothetical protein BDV40DRAFT_273462 [Aspergillus tamarii]
MGEFIDFNVSCTNVFFSFISHLHCLYFLSVWLEIVLCTWDEMLDMEDLTNTI